MNKNSIRRTILLLIVGGCVLWYFFGHGLVVGREESQNDINLEIGLWTSGTTVEQTFTASQDQLCRLDVYVDSYHPWDNPFLEYRLFEIEAANQTRKEVRRTRLNGWLISGHMFNQWTFAPLSDSKDRHYVLSIRSPELKTGGTSILKASPVDRYEAGSLFVNGEQQEGDLAFRAVYAQPTRQVVQRSAWRLALQKPCLFAKPVAFYCLFALYLVLLLSLCCLV